MKLLNESEIMMLGYIDTVENEVVLNVPTEGYFVEVGLLTGEKRSFFMTVAPHDPSYAKRIESLAITKPEYIESYKPFVSGMSAIVDEYGVNPHFLHAVGMKLSSTSGDRPLCCYRVGTDIFILHNGRIEFQIDRERVDIGKEPLLN